MLRRISYRSAATVFVFTGLWFVFGLFVLWTPVPGALGIGGQLFAVWLVLFLLILAGSGLTLFFAALNGIFPPNVRAPSRADQLWASPGEVPPATLPQRPNAAGRRRPGARTRGG
ncbi:MAG TPA: hypothetical protein VEZ14_06775 [Dehalococcoidia bacterium]|nr:hypothetical protein [Dehalococcoidia bacterium]